MKQAFLLTLFAFGCVGCLAPQPQIQTPQPEQARTASATPLPAVILTARDVKAAPDIEEALRWATSDGMHPGTVLLDGSQGPFTYTGDDRSINLFFSDILLRGVNGAVITNCDDGVFLDNLLVDRVTVSDLAFQCRGNGLAGIGAHTAVAFANNLVQANSNGITIGLARDWTISGNSFVVQGSGVHLIQSRGVSLFQNEISADTGILLESSQDCLLQNNTISARTVGISLVSESYANQVTNNSLLGMTLFGVYLAPDTAQNKVQANRILCAPEASCQPVEVQHPARESNQIADNLP